MSEHIRGRLDAYLEGRLDSGSQKHVEQHVARCGRCRKALELARQALRCIDWLAPVEAPPEPGPEFYLRLERAIERRLARNWLENFGATLRLRLAYPLLFLGVLVVVWTFTSASDYRDPEEGLQAIEYPAPEFARMAFTTADQNQSKDLVMMNLVEVPAEQ